MRASWRGAYSQCARCPATLSFPGSVPSWPSATRPRWRPPDRPRRTPVGRGKHRTGAGWRTPETSPPPAPSETNADEGIAGESKHTARSAQAPLATGTRAAIESLARGFAFPAMRHPGLLRRRRPGSSEPSKERRACRGKPGTRSLRAMGLRSDCLLWTIVGAVCESCSGQLCHAFWPLARSRAVAVPSLRQAPLASGTGRAFGALPRTLVARKLRTSRASHACDCSRVSMAGSVILSQLPCPSPARRQRALLRPPPRTS